MNTCTIGGTINYISQLQTTDTGKQTITMFVNVKRRKKDGVAYDNFKVKCFGITAEYANKYIAKGDYVMVNGVLTINEYTDKDGKKVKELIIFSTDIENVRRTEYTAKEEYKIKSKEDRYIDSSDSITGANEIMNSDIDEELPF